MQTLQTNDYAALVQRLALGTVLIAHALLKALVFTLPGAAGFFASQGFPGWSVYPVTLIELVAGGALILGLYSRIAALAALPVLLGALKVHLPNGWLFSNADGGWEYPAVLALAAVSVALLGDGRFSLRRALFRPAA